MGPVRLPHLKNILRFAVLLAAGVLAGCASAPVSAPVQGGGALASPPPLPMQGAVAYRVVQADSQLRLRVYRAGPLAALGHNHVISTSDIQGTIYVQPKLERSGFELRIPLKSFVIDKTVQRAQEGPGFEAEPSASARAGTRANMLGSAVLDAVKYPDMTLRSLNMVGPPWYPRIAVRVTLHGVSHDYVVPTALFHAPQGRLVATGGLTLKQSDFGIKPFSILNGGLRVRDSVDVSFHLVLAPKG